MRELRRRRYPDRARSTTISTALRAPPASGLRTAFRGFDELRVYCEAESDALEANASYAQRTCGVELPCLIHVLGSRVLPRGERLLNQGLHRLRWTDEPGD